MAETEGSHSTEPTAPDVEQQVSNAWVTGGDHDLPQVREHRQQQHDAQAVRQRAQGSGEDERASEDDAEQEMECADDRARGHGVGHRGSKSR